jgi:membrane protein implicated in regulation of membrane protease activity
LYGGAGLFAVFGLGCLVATAVLALAGPLSAWLAALIVALILFVIAGAAALMGKREVSQATPPMPAEAVEGVKQDMQTLKPGSS